MKERFDYQASPRLDMTFKTYKKSSFYFICLLLLLFFRELKPKKKHLFN